MLTKFVFIVLFHAILATKKKEYYDVDNDETVKKLFEDFLLEHKKNYEDNEKAKRLSIFHETLKNINQLNKEHPLTIFGINFFTDVTHEEMKKYTGCLPDPPGTKGSCPVREDLSSLDYPETLDWREKGVVTPIRAQADCGSCWAFSATATVESQYAMKTGQQVDLSEQQLVDCDTTSNGCDGGYQAAALSYLISSGGQSQESDYPYQAEQGSCRFNSSQAAVRVTSCNSFSLSSEEELKGALAETGPISITIDATAYKGYKGGILTNCILIELNHAVQLVGYGSDGGSEYWIVKNSWGTNWGENGYVRVQMGVNCNGMLNNQMYTATVA